MIDVTICLKWVLFMTFALCIFIMTIVLLKGHAQMVVQLMIGLGVVSYLMTRSTLDDEDENEKTKRG